METEAEPAAQQPVAAFLKWLSAGLLAGLVLSMQAAPADARANGFAYVTPEYFSVKKSPLLNKCKDNKKFKKAQKNEVLKYERLQKKYKNNPFTVQRLDKMIGDAKRRNEAYGEVLCGKRDGYPRTIANGEIGDDTGQEAEDYAADPYDLDALRRIDEKLYKHLEEQGLDFLSFSFRWMNCLLMRELPLPPPSILCELPPPPLEPPTPAGLTLPVRSSVKMTDAPSSSLIARLLTGESLDTDTPLNAIILSPTATFVFASAVLTAVTTLSASIESPKPSGWRFVSVTSTGIGTPI